MIRNHWTDQADKVMVPTGFTETKWWGRILTWESVARRDLEWVRQWWIMHYETALITEDEFRSALEFVNAT